MPSESITGISFPSPLAMSDTGSTYAVLKRVAACCEGHLLAEGYLAREETDDLQADYENSLMLGSPPVDILAFIAARKAHVQSMTIEGEVLKMQRILRARLNAGVHHWSFGPLPGRPTLLYDRCPPLRVVCAALNCPATAAGEASVLHVASINPVAALVASAWIAHQMSQEVDHDTPYVFPFMVEFSAWNVMLNRHFAS